MGSNGERTKSKNQGSFKENTHNEFGDHFAWVVWLLTSDYTEKSDGLCRLQGIVTFYTTAGFIEQYCGRTTHVWLNNA